MRAPFIVCTFGHLGTQVKSRLVSEDENGVAGPGCQIFNVYSTLIAMAY
jgi:hypothetical protein